MIFSFGIALKHTWVSVTFLYFYLLQLLAEHVYISALQRPYIMLLCIYIVSKGYGLLNYLEAKTVLSKDHPEVPFTLLALEVAGMTGIAATLVWIFA